MNPNEAAIGLEKFLEIGCSARPEDREHALQAFHAICDSLSKAVRENMRVRDLANQADIPPDVIRGIERLHADLAAARFAEREWKDKAQDKVAEVELLQNGMDALREHYELTFESLRAEMDSLVAYLGDVAGAVENHNVKRQQIADMLRGTQEKLRDGAAR